MDWLRLLSWDSGDGNVKPGHHTRSVFEQDYDRIIFSHPFRRLQDKTQVFPLPEHDFVHNRLTHSLEVSSVGRSLGKKAGEIILSRQPELAEAGITVNDFGNIVAAASLAHDVGNPPFGHSGENAISDFFKSNQAGQFFKDHVEPKEWADLINFEGNAQGFRIIGAQKKHGLKLTSPTLAAFTKYPRESLIDHPDPDRRSQKKYGYFQNDKHVYHDLAETLGIDDLGDSSNSVWARHPLAFLVEAADDICYLIIDLEDGCRLGLVSFEETLDLMSGILGEKLQPAKFHSIPDINEKLGLLRAMTIGVLIDETIEVFADMEKQILDHSFDSSLTDVIPHNKHLSRISDISIRRIYRSPMVMEREIAGFEVLDGLLETFSSACYRHKFDRSNYTARNKAVFRLIPESLRHSLENEELSVYQVLRASLDFVSGLTDSHALSLHRKIRGTSLTN